MQFTKAFLFTALEGALTTGLATFAASDVFTIQPTEKGFIAAGIAAGMAALYQLVKELGAQGPTAAEKRAAKVAARVT